MRERLLEKFGRHYILVMMLLTRMFGCVGGLLVIYYVELTLRLPEPIRAHFWISAIVVVIIGCTLTVILAMWETRHLRRVLQLIDRRERLDPVLAAKAGREAVIFAGRHHRHEAWLVPCSTLVPVLIFLKVWDDASPNILLNITLAVFMGISIALMSTFFAVDHCMQPVIRRLLDFKVAIDYRSLPVGRLRFRLGVCSTLIIMTTALMIGTLARQRVSGIMSAQGPERDQLVQSLYAHSTYITFAAVITGVVYSTVLARSVATRVARLVRAMERVRNGVLSERVRPTGNDEIDVLARQFNSMIEQLDHHNRMINDLNANLEFKVKFRTQQLEANVQELQETQAQLIHSEKMASLGQLVAGVAHELNNSINAVYNGIQPLNAKTERMKRMVCEALKAGNGAFPPSLKEEIETSFAKIGKLAGVIEHGASRSARIVSDLKTFSHPGTEEAAEFDLHELLDMSLNLLSNQLRNRITVHKIYAKSARIYGPRSQLSQVFLNILTNAQQAIPERGEIYITTARHDEQISVSIRDTGTGIPEEIKERIFDPFLTTKDPGEGTGLGLSISYGIVTKLGGTIECRSEPAMPDQEIDIPSAFGEAIADRGHVGPQFRNATPPPASEITSGGQKPGSEFIVTLPLDCRKKIQQAEPDASPVAADDMLGAVL